MKRLPIIKLHLVFWGLTLFMLIVYFIFEITDDSPFCVHSQLIVQRSTILISYVFVFKLIYKIITFYSFYFSFSPKIITKIYTFLYFIFSLVFLGLINVIFTFISSSLLGYILYSNNSITFNKGLFINLLLSNFVYAIMGFMMKVIFNWYEKSRKQEELEKQNILNELALIRAQINPHFLFNTLNNVKSFVNHSPDKAIQYIEKLSDIMRYILYGSSEEKIQISKEIDYIKNYIELQKIRYSNPDYIELNISGKYSEKILPPMLFMPFIENAFKYGNKFSPTPGISIKFNFNEDDINFEISNYYTYSKEINKLKHGFGIPNTKRRLDLLFSNKYQLDITNANNIFTVKLNIKTK